MTRRAKPEPDFDEDDLLEDEPIDDVTPLPDPFDADDDEEPEAYGIDPEPLSEPPTEIDL
jgi:hypothetical protein